MTTSTPILGIRYPIDTDAPATYGVHTAIQNMANDFDQYFGPWTAWTPQVDQGATTNIAKTINVARYRLTGKFLEFEMRLSITGTGTALAAVLVSPPLNSKFPGYMAIGWGGVEDVSAVQDYQRVAVMNTGSSTRFGWMASGGLLGASIFTAALAAGDILSATGFMETP